MPCRSRRNFLALSSTVPLTAAASVLPLDGCADDAGAQGTAAYRIDSRITSRNQDSRVRTLVLHYTAQPLEVSLRTLTEAEYQVSAHYLVPDAPDRDQVFRIYRLVDEARRAWHAGISYWQGDRMLNAGSIGIEIVNPGFPAQDENAPLMNRRWYPYPDAQIEVVAQLAASLIARHEIRPHKVVGHADVAPGRKWDPGPLFPWQAIFERHRIGAWPDAEAVDYYRHDRPFDGNIAQLQSKLLAYGYDTPQSGLLDPQTADVVAAFQMHFRPARYDGVPDVETVAVLDALLEKYFGMGRPGMLRTPVQGPVAPAVGEKGSDVWPLPDGARPR